MGIFDVSFISITENAVIKSYEKLGDMEKEEIDKLAVEGMESTISQYPYNFNVKSGEGAIDEAPELSVNNKIKYKKTLDIIVDPIEGTTLASKNQNGSISVIGIGEEGTFRNIPDMYALKIFSPYKFSDSINIKSSLKEIIIDLSKTTKKNKEDIIVAILDKPRHEIIIKELNNLGVIVEKIKDGDVLVALEMYYNKKYDLFYGIGGAPEGMINAAIINHIKGSFFMKLKYIDEVKQVKVTKKLEEQKICKLLNVDIDEELTTDNIINSNNYIISATGLTNSDLLKGIKKKDDKYFLNSIFINKRGSKIINTIKKG